MKPVLVIASAVSASLAACAGGGHYWTRATIDGRGMDMLVDTGASTVALTRADARALGLDPSRLAYARTVVTAAGRTRAAPVTLARLAVGPVAVEGVPALVVDRGLERSLLGMSYLGRLKGFSADAEGMTLTR